MEAYGGWWCPNEIHYRMVITESLDEDTETRRAGPMAQVTGDYVDLINGPQDHGWCSGYTCRLRLTIMPSLVKAGADSCMY